MRRLIFIILFFSIFEAASCFAGSGSSCFMTLDSKNHRYVNPAPALDAFLKGADADAAYYRSVKGTEDGLERTFAANLNACVKSEPVSPFTLDEVTVGLKIISAKCRRTKEVFVENEILGLENMKLENYQDILAINGEYGSRRIPQAVTAGDAQGAVSSFRSAIKSMAAGLRLQGSSSKWGSMIQVLLDELNAVSTIADKDFSAIFADQTFRALAKGGKLYKFLIDRASLYSTLENADFQNVPRLTPVYAKILLLYTLRNKMLAVPGGSSSAQDALDGLARRLHVKANLSPTGGGATFGNSLFVNGYLLASSNTQNENVFKSAQTNAGNDTAIDCTTFVQYAAKETRWSIPGRLTSKNYRDRGKLPDGTTFSSIGDGSDLLKMQAGDIIFTNDGKDGHAMTIVGFSKAAFGIPPQPIVLDAVGESVRALRTKQLNIFAYVNGCLVYKPTGGAASLLAPKMEPTLAHLSEPPGHSVCTEFWNHK